MDPPEPTNRERITFLMQAFPNHSREDVREAIERFRGDEEAQIRHLQELEPFTRMTARSKRTGEERPLKKRLLKPADLEGEHALRFKVCDREDDAALVHRCYPKMVLTCTNCKDKSSWASVGFRADFSFRRNHDRFNIIGEILMFRQHCKRCGTPVWPDCDRAVIERFLRSIALRIEANNGGGGGRPTLDEQVTHLRDLCEGCEVDVCRFAGTQPPKRPPRRR